MSSHNELGEHPVSSISSLSVDHFAIIATFLDTEDIKNARLAGRELHFYLSPYLIQSVRYAPHKSCLDIIDAISRDSVLSHNVKTLRFDASIFRLPMVIDSLDKWEFHSSQEKQVSSLLYPTDLATHIQALESYTDYVAQQETINKSLETILCRVLEAFPKLTTLILTNTFIEKGYPSFKYALQRNTVSRKWIRPYQLLSLFHAISKSRCKITKIDVEGHWVQKRYPDNSHFGDESQIPGSIRYCFPDLQSARYWKEKKPFILSDVFSFNLEDLSMTKGIFHNLTHLNLCVSTVVPMNRLLSWPNPPKAYWADLPKVLQTLPNIIHLSLDLKIHRQIDKRNIYYYHHNDIAEIFGNPPPNFPRLKSLSIAQFRSSAQTVSSLLRRNPTIENLTLRFMIRILDPGVNPYATYFPGLEWERIIDTMRNMRLKRLDLFGIEGFGRNFERFGDENENLRLSRIHDYILHGYGNNPLRQRATADDWDKELW